MPTNHRRAFLTGRAAAAEVEAAGERLADAVLRDIPQAPSAGDTIRLETTAMACTWQVILNPGDPSQVMHASDALDLVHRLESLMTVYRDDGQLAIVNRDAAERPVDIDPLLADVLAKSLELTEQTCGAFDVTGGALVSLWRECRREERVPTDEEIDNAKSRTGVELVALDVENQTVRFAERGVELNLGAIGKGYALDRAAAHLVEQGVTDFLIHGGASSVLTHGVHAGHGWPVGIKNPLFNDQSMATVILGDVSQAAGRALGTSGGNVQYFRVGGRRYGHILDPRTGRPAEGLMSVSVVADDAMTADAFSTAMFVAGRDESIGWCDQRAVRGAILTPPPRGRNVAPEVCQLVDESLFFDVSPAKVSPETR